MDTKTDPANCGSCGAACGGGQVCTGGQCVLVCVGGTTKRRVQPGMRRRAGVLERAVRGLLRSRHDQVRQHLHRHQGGSRQLRKLRGRLRAGPDLPGGQVLVAGQARHLQRHPDQPERLGQGVDRGGSARLDREHPALPRLPGRRLQPRGLLLQLLRPEPDAGVRRGRHRALHGRSQQQVRRRLVGPVPELLRRQRGLHGPVQRAGREQQRRARRQRRGAVQRARLQGRPARGMAGQQLLPGGARAHGRRPDLDHRLRRQPGLRQQVEVRRVQVTRAQRELRHLCLFVTESCNLACAYCFASNREGQGIDAELARQAIDQALGADNVAPDVGLSFWGGEPLLVFGLIERLVLHAAERARASGKRVRFSLPTNLTLLDDSTIDFLQRHGVALSLSCDGEAPAQDRRRTRAGAGSFAVVRDKLDLVARRYGARLPAVRMTVSPATAARLRENVRFFVDRGFDHIHFAPVVEADWSERELDSLARAELALAGDWIAALGAGRRLRFPTWEKALAWRRHARAGASPAERALLCGAGRSMVAVDIHGDVYPCQRFVFYDKQARKHALGSVHGGLLAAVRTGLAFDAARLGTRAQPCCSCPEHARCTAVCPALGYRLCGDVHVVDERLCLLGAAQARAVDYLESRLPDEPALGRHLEQVLAVAGQRDLFAWLDRAEPGRLAARAGEILAGLGGGRTGAQ
ncbi:MAG: 4Fe-4S cluster-binding domain-containing protein [Deltaproteobacteria bacterium]|nr:4Fe-4S cluster-binding domain-containing protein [Deltaproteobacteria bacterium]